MKLSKAQKRVLGVMEQPKCTACVYNGLRRHAAFLLKGGRREKGLRPVTLEKLEELGLVEDVTPPSLYGRGSIYYRITDAGRAELQGLS